MDTENDLSWQHNDTKMAKIAVQGIRPLFGPQ